MKRKFKKVTVFNKYGDRVEVDIRSVQENSKGITYVFFKLDGSNEVEMLNRFIEEYPGVLTGNGNMLQQEGRYDKYIQEVEAI